ncbi:hypothetical protein MTBSS4_380001 [Magnetospirillum sp. SS-4]|nr:hypothetical protein MTBSS4_380001 [Magnetospirillum sp. SS-4]
MPLWYCFASKPHNRLGTTTKRGILYFLRTF